MESVGKWTKVKHIEHVGRVTAKLHSAKFQLSAKSKP